MIRLTFALFAALFLASVSASSARCPRYVVKKFVDTAHGSRGLQDIVSKYREELGGIDNLNEAGPLDDGHRSINWDAAAVPFDMPFDFFDRTVTRGAVFKAKGKKFAVSNPAMAPPEDDRFSSLLTRRVSRQFRRFSRERLFTPVLRNKFSVIFNVPAQRKRATTTGFGAVYTDVDLKFATKMKFFDRRGCLIAKLAVPPKSRGLSFAGIVVLDPHNPYKLIPAVAKVVVRLGNISVDDFQHGHLKPHVKNDLVVVDDLVYGEPQPMH